MMLRLVLVGVVAALGVSVPSQPSCEHWFESAQAWTTSLIAEWDTWEPEVEDGPRLVGTQNAIGCEECRLARMRLLASAPETSKADVIVAQGNSPTKSPENSAVVADSKASEPPATASETTPIDPIELAEIIAWEFVYGSDAKADESADEAPAPPVSELLFALADASQPLDAAGLGIWGELFVKANEPAVSSGAKANEPAVSTGEAESECLVAEEYEWSDSDRSCICSFGDIEIAQHAAPKSPSKPVESPKSSPAALVEPLDPTGFLMSCLDEESAFDNASDRVDVTREANPVLAELPSELFAVPNVTISATPRPSPMAPVAESIAAVSTPDRAPRVYPFVMADLPTDLFGPGPDALDLKPMTKVQPVPEAAPLAGAQPPTPRLGDAVELTRRAMSAWVSVLIGPALVDGSRR